MDEPIGMEQCGVAIACKLKMWLEEKPARGIRHNRFGNIFELTETTGQGLIVKGRGKTIAEALEDYKE